jgi:hypothetical protein
VIVTDDGTAVDDLLAAVKAAIKQANISATDADRDLTVAQVRVTLNTVATRTAGGGVDFRVPFIGMKLKFGAKVTHQNTHTIDVTLIPGRLPQFEVRDTEVEQALVEAITTVRRIMAAGAHGDDPFDLQTGTIDLQFAVTRNGTVTFGVDADLTDEVTQTLHLEIRPPVKP